MDSDQVSVYFFAAIGLVFVGAGLIVNGPNRAIKLIGIGCWIAAALLLHLEISAVRI